LISEDSKSPSPSFSIVNELRQKVVGMPAVTGFGTIIINWVRRNTAISSLQTAFYDWAFSNLKAVPEDQAAVLEALASGNADGSMMDITEEEMLELLRMQGGDDDLGFDLGRKISAEQRMQDREVLRRRRSGTPDVPSAVQNAMFSCDLTEKGTLEVALARYWRKHNPSKAPDDISYIAGKYAEKPLKLIRMLEAKYGDHLSDFCPDLKVGSEKHPGGSNLNSGGGLEDQIYDDIDLDAVLVEGGEAPPPPPPPPPEGEVGVGTTTTGATAQSAWQLHPAYTWAAATVVLTVALLAFFGAPLKGNPKRAGQVDSAALALLAVGAACMGPSTHVANALVLGFGGAQLACVVARFVEVRHASRPMTDAQRHKIATQKKRKDWYNY
jgi:hypothetical protein